MVGKHTMERGFFFFFSSQKERQMQKEPSLHKPHVEQRPDVLTPQETHWCLQPWSSHRVGRNEGAHLTYVSNPIEIWF